jgi:photosystem II stability/assembly factor-like uncharacterized protein
MKKSIMIIIIILIASSTQLSSEWKQVYEKNDNYEQIVKAFDCFGDYCIGCYEGSLDAWIEVSINQGINWELRHYDSLYYYRDKNGDYIYDSTTKEYLYHKPYYFRDVKCISENFWIAICDSGYYYISHDAFETWELKQFPNTFILHKLAFLNDSVGIIGVVRNSKIELHITRDQCNTWVDITPDLSEFPEKTAIDDVCWTPEGGIFIAAFSYDITTDQRCNIFYSNDSGKTYQNVGGTHDRLSDFHYFNKEIGIGVGGIGIQYVNSENSEHNIISKTTDGGKTWERKVDKLNYSKYKLQKVEFYDDLKGVAYLPHRWDYWVTTDGGDTWAEDPTYDLAYNGKKGLNSHLISMRFLDNGDLIGQNNYGTVWRQDFVTGVRDLPELQRIIIFPNPIQLGATATIVLNIEQQGMYQFAVYDTRGELVDQHQEFLHISENRIEYTPEHLPTGMYYIQIEGIGSRATIKLVVE